MSGIGGGAGYPSMGIGGGAGFQPIGIGSGIGVHFSSFSTANTFYNPPFPFQAPVNGFGGESRLRIVLVPQTSGDRFSINLKRGGEYLLHFNPRLEDGKIVLNSTRNGSWVQEDYRPNVFHRGDVYTVELFAEPNNSVRIVVNGEQIASFDARNGDYFNDVDALEIDGSVKLHSVTIHA